MGKKYVLSLSLTCLNGNTQSSPAPAGKPNKVMLHCSPNAAEAAVAAATRRNELRSNISAVGGGDDSVSHSCRGHELHVSLRSWV